MHGHSYQMSNAEAAFLKDWHFLSHRCSRVRSVSHRTTNAIHRYCISTAFLRCSLLSAHRSWAEAALLDSLVSARISNARRSVKRSRRVHSQRAVDLWVWIHQLRLVSDHYCDFPGQVMYCNHRCSDVNSIQTQKQNKSICARVRRTCSSGTNLPLQPLTPQLTLC